MRTLTSSRWFLLFSACITLSGPMYAAQTAKAPSPATAGWALGYAAPAPSNPSLTSDIGRGNPLIWDKRFLPLLEKSLPQRQTFWYDHSRLVPVPSLALTFLGVTGDAIADQDRYVTVDGCVSHDCVVNRSVLWIDTGASPAKVIFAGIDMAHSNAGQDISHLWIFSREKLDPSSLPKPFVASVQRWLIGIGAKGYRGTEGYHYNFALATLVQPNGVTIDMDPANLHLNDPKAGANL